MQGFRIRAGRLFLHYCSELGPTEFLQGREPVEVGFDGRLVGGWQVWQALEGAWERQVVGLRLRGQDATYPIVFWRHIHTYTDTEEGKRGGNGQADVSYATPPPKRRPQGTITERPPAVKKKEWAGRQAGVSAVQIFAGGRGPLK